MTQRPSTPSLADLFKKGFDAQKTIESGNLASDSKEYKQCLAEAVSSLEAATVMVNNLGLFSSNEELEDVATADLKYMLLPALLADVTLQQVEGDRLKTVQKTLVYCVDYLHRCKEYSITKEEIPDISPPSGACAPPPKRTLEQLAAERTAKITRLKTQKQLERAFEELTSRLDAEGGGDHEEALRDHTLTLLKVWVYKCLDLLRSASQELELLELGPVAMVPEPAPTRPPSKPFVITREMMQAHVLGAGYPSLPTVSLEQFYRDRYKEQADAHMNSAPGDQRSHEEVREKMREDAAEVETEESLRQARAFDDYKDTHRYGSGNRKNMG
ncbi:hypothetical protein EMCRGX_G004254 [Ephydatia muelleri]